jgi:hypothetical protein
MGIISGTGELVMRRNARHFYWYGMFIVLNVAIFAAVYWFAFRPLLRARRATIAIKIRCEFEILQIPRQLSILEMEKQSNKRLQETHGCGVGR